MNDYPIIKLVKLKNNVGPAAARDFGAGASLGELLFFTEKFFLKKLFKFSKP